MKTWYYFLILLSISLAGVGTSTQASLKEKSPAGFSTVNPTVNPVECSVISSVTGTGGQETILFGIHFKIHPGWKIYAPAFKGQKGADQTESLVQPPVFDWSGSTNYEKIHLHWPPAHAIIPEISEPKSKGGSEGIGVYTRSFILPLTVDLQTIGVPLFLEGVVSMIACHHQCVPVTQKLTFYLPQGMATPTNEAQAILAARVQKETARVQKGNSKPEDEKTVLGRVKSLLITVKNQSSFLWILLLSFLGGAALNFMPCVLPVLSLKLRSFSCVSSGGDSQQGARLKKKSGASLLGILVSFWSLAGAAIGIERSGEIFGWGFHFQSPAFLGVMLIILLLFAKSLWQGGGFDLPNGVRNKLQSLLGEKAIHRQDLVENFLTGVFATLLATPCTAPFLGTALAYALSRGPLEIILLFTVMGLGFAFPYLVLCVMPPSKIWIPKPGAWMERLSRFFALLLWVTIIWIGWLLSQQVPLLYWGSFIGILLFSFSLYSNGLSSPLRGVLKKTGAVFLVGLVVAVVGVSPPSQSDLSMTLEEGWEPFDEGKIHTYVQAGKTVFVDVTAAWCLTCQANKQLVLRTGAVKKALENVVKMRANWTKPNPKISAYLKSFNRYGIPFNVIYSPASPQGVVLPELLTKQSVLNQVKVQVKEELN